MTGGPAVIEGPKVAAIDRSRSERDCGVMTKLTVLRPPPAECCTVTGFPGRDTDPTTSASSCRCTPIRQASLESDQSLSLLRDHPGRLFSTTLFSRWRFPADRPAPASSPGGTGTAPFHR